MGSRVEELMRDRAPGDMPDPFEFGEAFDADFAEHQRNLKSKEKTMLENFKAKWSAFWTKLKAWFKDSETIFWARVQVLVGIVAAVLPTLNPIAWLDAALTPAQRWTAAAFAIGNGLLTEYLRRRRAEDL